MATTGFWPIKGRLKDAIDYAENPDKTTDRKYPDEDLYNALRYAWVCLRRSMPFVEYISVV
jgi:hypothetical protein